EPRRQRVAEPLGRARRRPRDREGRGMNLFADALAWLLSPERLQGQYALPTLLGQHLLYTAISVAGAAAIALPAGWLIGHTGRGREIAVAISGAARAVPSFGLLVLLVLLLGRLRTPP